MKFLSGTAIIAFSGLLIAGLVAAAQTTTEDTPTPEELRREKTMQVIRGAKAWKENCGRCHNLRSPRELTDQEWDVSVTHMRVRANLSATDADDIREFLKASNE